MRTVNFNTVIPGLNGSGCRCRKLSFDLKDLVHGKLPWAAGQLLGRNRYRTCRDRFTDPVAARVVELYKSLAPARVDRVGELPVFFDALVRRDGELPLRRASAFRDAAVLGDDNAGAAIHSAVVIVLHQLRSHMAAVGFVRLHRRHDKTVGDIELSDADGCIKNHGVSPFQNRTEMRLNRLRSKSY